MAVGLALVCVCGGCDTAADSGRTATGGTAGASPTRPVAGSTDSTPIRRAGNRERERFELLRRAPQPLPVSVRRLLGEPQHGMNWMLARRLPLRLDRSFWLVPGRGALCLVHSAGGDEAATACAPTDRAVSHGVVAVSLRDAQAGDPARRLIVGVVPDGVSEATLRSGGRTTAVRIRRHQLLVREDSVGEPLDSVSLAR